MTGAYENVACTVCGCVCDDLRVTVENQQVVQLQNACPLAEPWFQRLEQLRPTVAEIDGREVPLERALDRAAEILQKSRSPVIYGLSRSSTEGQRAAVALADRLGASIDTTASLCHAPSVLALEESGESTCTLGEIKNRADLVIFWGCDPLTSHPRHLERYSVDPRGEFTPEGRSGRTVVVVDSAPSATSAMADVFLQIDANRDFEALWTLRALVHGHDVPATPVLVDLARRMKACRFGIVFFGVGLSMQELGHRVVEALLRLTSELNDYARFYARRMRVQGDVTGADSVLAWQTGYPFSVNLARGYPRYNPGEFSAHEMILRGEADALVLVGSEGVERFSAEACARLNDLPTIVLDYPHCDTPLSPTVRFTTAIYGVHRPGTVYRMDEVPIPLSAFLTSTLPTDADILGGIHARLGP